jgi:hypothetical protein
MKTILGLEGIQMKHGDFRCQNSGNMAGDGMPGTNHRMRDGHVAVFAEK